MQAGAQIVVEEFLTGEEASFFAFIDGETCIPLVGAQVRAGGSSMGWHVPVGQARVVGGNSRG